LPTSFITASKMTRLISLVELAVGRKNMLLTN
jgi:hypothetical protein